ncbi:PT domain-containing protein, partial [Cellulomonas sp. 179-A 9B4 NHS]|uniref:PT domain-containing protein n=1 Tax=Cellulomonas sp. 179-A 9B4 NHS TaxID=3142379 RepID=UPI00399F1D12
RRTAPEAGRALPDVVAADEAAGARVLSDPVAVDAYHTLGVTWSLDAAPDEVDVQVRTRTDGTWSAWVPLESDGVTPDPGTVEAGRDLRAGTESVWIGEAEDVQLAFGAGGDAAADVRLALVGPEDEVRERHAGAPDEDAGEPADAPTDQPTDAASPKPTDGPADGPTDGPTDADAGTAGDTARDVADQAGRTGARASRGGVLLALYLNS